MYHHNIVPELNIMHFCFVRVLGSRKDLWQKTFFFLQSAFSDIFSPICHASTGFAQHLSRAALCFDACASVFRKGQQCLTAVCVAQTPWPSGKKRCGFHEVLRCLKGWSRTIPDHQCPQVLFIVFLFANHRVLLIGNFVLARWPEEERRFQQLTAASDCVQATSFPTICRRWTVAHFSGRRPPKDDGILTCPTMSSYSYIILQKEGCPSSTGEYGFGMIWPKK